MKVLVLLAFFLFFASVAPAEGKNFTVTPSMGNAGINNVIKGLAAGDILILLNGNSACFPFLCLTQVYHKEPILALT